MKHVAIVDYGMGNVDSVRRAFEECGARATITADPAALRRANALVLPGVGAFGAGIENLRARGLEEVLRELVLERRVPFIGLCLGMQLLATLGRENGTHRGLGWIDGEVVRLEGSPRERVPHVGWNDVHPRPGGDAAGARLFAGIPDGADFYFVHSYRFVPADPADTAATVPYCGQTVAAVARGNVTGVQFHPEKSQRPGFQLLRNFLAGA